MRPHLVPGGEQEEIEEDRLDDGRDFDIELPDQNPGQQRPDDDPEAETPELNAADQKANRKRQKDRQLGIVPQCLYEKSQDIVPVVRTVFHADKWSVRRG